MSLEGFDPITIDTFGSWVTIQDAYKEANVSPDCQDVEFYPGGVRTRPGFPLSYAALGSSINSLAAFNPQQPQIGQAIPRRLLVLTADGRLLKDVAGALQLIVNTLAPGMQMNTCTAFGRSWMGFSDGTQGADIPRQYDDVNFDRVSMEGPGAGPAGVADAVAAGNIVPGVHQVCTFFILRSGYKTRLSPPVAWTAAGAKKVTIPLPIGPANVVGRGVAITTAGGASFYCVQDRMLVGDNVTAAITIDFTDGTLSGGLPVDYLRGLEVLPDAMMPLAYASRMFWIGEQPMMQFWANLMFDGGFAGGFPLGWTAAGLSPGGSEDAGNALFGSAYRITGDGATDSRGLISQSALLDPFQGVPLIVANTAYTVRARIKRSAGLVAGTLNIDLFGTGLDTVGLQVPAAQAAAGFTEYTAQLTAALGALPVDLVLRVFANGTPTNGEYFVVDDIRIFPSTTTRTSVSRGSRAFDPESYNGAATTSGKIQVSPDDGQDLRSHFSLRNFYYLVKERSLWVTQDDGINEPSKWQLTPVSETVGTPSAKGIGWGEGFRLIINEKGCYRYSGGLRLDDSNKVSNEIQPTWDSVNWADAGQKTWIAVDDKRKRAYIGLPVGANQLTCNQVWTLDWSGGWADPIENNGQGRQWAPWLPLAGDACLCGVVAPIAGGLTFYIGANAAGAVYQLGASVAAQPKDAAATPIHSWYQTSYVTRPENTRRGQASHGVNELGYITGPVYGAGDVKISALQDAQGNPVLLGSWTQELALTKDLEMNVDVVSERIAVKVETNAVGAYFDMSLLTLHTHQSPWSPVRGA